MFYKKLTVLLLLFTLLSCQSQSVGIALGGGGAKGAAHIGVLKVLDALNIEIDYISGTSIGAIIGGLYAAGYTPEEIEDIFFSMDWNKILSGKRILSELEKAFDAKNCKTFEDLKIPFRCVAFNSETGEEVVMSHGPLAIAIRASMSIPKVYETVHYNGMLLWDGGMINNLPVDVAMDMGAQKVIAVDLEEGEGVDFGYSPSTDKLIEYLYRRPDVKKLRENRKNCDVYIKPEIENFNMASFGWNNGHLMMEQGEIAAKQVKRELKALKSN